MVTGSAHVIPPLSDVAGEAAASTEVRNYLTARGITTVGTLALVATDEQSFKTTVIEPLLAGWRHGGSAISLSEPEKPIATAMLLHMWGVARRHWAHSMLIAPASTSSTATSPTPPVPKSSADDKPPKTLPAGVWGQLVTKYNKIQLNGVDRAFPAQEILGAESVIARMYHEHQHSRTYTPVLLGEILQSRSFQSNGEVNPLAKANKKTTALAIEDGLVIEKEDKVWEPRSVLALLDGLNAVRWATILVEWGAEIDVHKYFDWLIQRVRTRPNKTEQLNAYYVACAWKIAMGMREGHTFAALSDQVMKDFDRFADFMSREDTPKKQTTGAKGKFESPKGHGKIQKGKQPRTSPYARRWPDTSSSSSSTWSSPGSSWRSSTPSSPLPWWQHKQEGQWREYSNDHKDYRYK